MDDLFEKLDKDHNGRIDLSEFLNGALELSLAFNEHRLREIFNALDVDKNGVIEKRELMSYVEGHPELETAVTNMASTADKDQDTKATFFLTF